MNKLMTKHVSKWSKKADLAVDALSIALDEVASGNCEASLGGNLFKKRVALKGKGKSGGSRVIVCFNHGDTIFALYAFKKNEKANISKDDLKILKDLAADYLALSEEDIINALEEKIIFEV